MTSETGSPTPATNAHIGELLEAARAGDRTGFAEIVRALSPMLWHVARAQGIDAETASDVVQQTWLALVRSLADIRTPAALTGWLVQVTKREAWRVARAGRAERFVDPWDLRDTPADDPGPEQLAVASDTQRRLWSLVKQLPERCQALLRIVAFVPRPDYDAISESLGVPHGSIGPTRGRCLARLRRLLEAGIPGEEGRTP
ncbi:RNA polymerase sigma factor [Amycolatopsis vancoresmycina]|uniref:RNA polymerase sigma-70 factor, ECF subfamily protein n=1 Tax=Amycolatopsis vancoresmycina DSM 44592 TaxID=1292037 RepID=R1FGG6_9PSEU|nr:sigma-70 family RNA polymerase sigma factor [Amycolatopsis vancoresmycina]EOD58687.1 RNA polymerase sigma-70 factor, ECF subfamily protein [Amycolatopsis vancoresmycina DSM 44592]